MLRILLLGIALAASAAAAVRITTTSLPPAVAGRPYTSTLQTTDGQAPFLWSISSGSLPSGLSLGLLTGQLSGTPQNAGAYNFEVRVFDAAGDNDRQRLTLTVNPPLAITTAALPRGTVGTAYSTTVSAAGGVSPYGWTLSAGSLPPGVQLSNTGQISGTPAAAGSFNPTLRVTDAAGGFVEQAFTVVITAALAVTTTALPGGSTGAPYSAALSASGGVTPYTWSIAAGALPAGVTLAPNGQLSGTPTASGSFNFTARVADAAGATATQALTLSIAAPLGITSTSVPPGVVGTPYSTTLAATGGTAPYAWRVASGTLPPGITLSTTGQLTGTPTTPGTYNFTAQVTDAANATASAPLTLTATAALAVTTTSIPAAVVGTPYSTTLAAAGGTAPYTWSVASGTLPPGVTLSTTGQLTGTPTTPGTYNFTAQVTDAANATASAPLTLTATAALAVTTTSIPGAVVGTPYSTTLAAAGGTAPYTWSVTTGTLPPGITLTTTGQLTGTPTTPGTYNFTAQVTDAANATASAPLALTTTAALTVTTTSIPAAVVGTAYSTTLAAAGGTAPYTWSVATGALPPGITLSTTGQLTGTPTTAGSYDFTVRVTDAANATAQRSLTLPVSAGLAITTTTLPDATVATPYTASLAASGGTAPYTWTIASGSLPPGLTLSTSGQFSGTPTTAGAFAFTARATDAAGATADRQYSVSVANPLTITTPSLPGGVAGTSYSAPLAATGGTAPYTWSLATGTLPPGLQLSPAGQLSGTPSAPGTYSITVRATDARSRTVDRTYTVVIAAPLAITTTALPAATTGRAYSTAVAATGGTPPYTWSITAGALPPGLRLSPAGDITGTPTAAGAFNITLRVTDANQRTAERTLVFQVSNPPLAIATPALPGGVVGGLYSTAVTATGGMAPYQWSIRSGNLPPGVRLDSSGLITGTPTAAGSFDVTLGVIDAAQNTAQQAYNIVIAEAGSPLTITTATLPGAGSGTVYSAGLVATGGSPPYTWTLQSGSLPPGVQFNAAGQLSGVPSAAGSFTFTARVRDAQNTTADRTFTLVVADTLLITACPAPAATATRAYNSAAIAAGGATPYAWTISTGALPQGVTLNAGTGVITGTPAAAGQFAFTLRVTDRQNTVAARDCALNVAAAPPQLSITTTSLSPGSVGGSYREQLTASGGTPPYEWVIVEGALPAGLRLTLAGVIEGTPIGEGAASFTVRSTDADRISATQRLTLTVGNHAITGVRIANVANVLGPAQQFFPDVELDAAAAAEITGTMRLTFTPDPGLPDDPAVQFSAGGRAVQFTVPAGATRAAFAAAANGVQTGTVAGIITLTLEMASNGANVTPSPAPSHTIRIDRLPPRIVSVRVRTVAGGFELLITGFATPREVTAGIFRFTPAPGSSLSTTEITVPLAEAARRWYTDPRSTQFGSQFLLVMPFSLQNASVSSVSVRLENSLGLSNSVDAQF